MDFKQWEGFNKGEWTSEIDVRDLFKGTTLHTQEMKVFYLVLLKRQANCGIKFLNCMKKNEKMVY